MSEMLTDVTPQDELDKVGAKLMTAERGAAEFQAEVAMLRRKETEYWETASRLKVILLVNKKRRLDTRYLKQVLT